MRVSPAAMRLPALVILAILFCLAGFALADPDHGGGLFGPTYPIEVKVSAAAGLFHWLDSLSMADGTGVSAGKTASAHQHEFLRLFGDPSGEDREVLTAYRAARMSFAARQIDLARRGADADPSSVLRTFLEADSVAEVLALAEVLMPADEVRAIRKAAGRFETRYGRVWDGGKVPRAFLVRVNRDDRRGELDTLLLRAARFYGVAPDAAAAPRLVLVPVPAGSGTHAQQVGRNLLLEVRPTDTLADQASVIVHENAHFLFEAMAEERRGALARAMVEAGPGGDVCWTVLREALPTALGQGVADRAFRTDDWSTAIPWYDRSEVDRFAKAIFPLVLKRLDGGKFDEGFVREAYEAWPDRPVTRRSPSP